MIDPPPDDRSLLDAARGGDRSALDALVTRYEPRVYRFGLAMCRDVDAAREVLQDTFLSMVRALHTFRGDAALSTWLFTIAHHACARRHRHTAASPRTLESLEGLTAADQVRLVAPGPDPEDHAIRRERSRRIDAALATLDPDQRAAVFLRDVEGLTALEASDALGVSVAALKSRLHRGRQALRERVAPTASSRATSGTCPDMVHAFSRHAEGDLSPADCVTMEAHLARCPRCRDACDALRGALALCRASTAPTVPAETRQRLRDALRACRLESAAG